jgi:hypothetical protein
LRALQKAETFGDRNSALHLTERAPGDGEEVNKLTTSMPARPFGDVQRYGDSGSPNLRHQAVALVTRKEPTEPISLDD